MLRYNNQLLFPTLKKISHDSHLNNLYQLDWTHVDTLKKERWLKTHQITSNQPFPGTLPREYLSWTDEMVFAIPQGLLDEIRLCSLKAMGEWSRRKPEIRWEPIPSQTPVSSYVYKAFHIIADCLHDPKTDSFSRDPKKILIPYTLSYRFWSFQIDPTKINLYAGLIDLKARFENKQSSVIDIMTSDFIESIEIHNQSLMTKNEEASRKIIPEATLIDVLENKRPSAYTKTTSIAIPGLGVMDLINIKFEKYHSPDFKITAEITNWGAIHLQDIKTSSIPLAFKICDDSGQLLIDSAIILGISSNPPPVITLRVYHCIWEKTDKKKPFIERHPNIRIVGEQDDRGYDVTTSIKKVDKNRIKKVRDDDLEANEDFKEIDMKANFSADNSVCLRPKNHK